MPIDGHLGIAQASGLGRMTCQTACQNGDQATETRHHNSQGIEAWDEAIHLPPWISSTEREQISQQLQGWADNLLKVCFYQRDALHKLGVQASKL